MRIKTFEIRDEGTFIPVMGIQLHPGCEEDRYFFARAGYGRLPEEQEKYVILVRIAGGTGQATCDPYDWGDARTMPVAHTYIIDHFEELESGAVVDVEYILKESDSPKVSERLEHQLEI